MNGRSFSQILKLAQSEDDPLDPTITSQVCNIFHYIVIIEINWAGKALAVH